MDLLKDGLQLTAFLVLTGTIVVCLMAVAMTIALLLYRSRPRSRRKYEGLDSGRVTAYEKMG